MSLIEIFFLVFAYLIIVMVFGREASVSYQLENWRAFSLWTAALCVIPASYMLMQFIPLPLSPYIDYLVFVGAIIVFFYREKKENKKLDQKMTEIVEGKRYSY